MKNAFVRSSLVLVIPIFVVAGVLWESAAQAPDKPAPKATLADLAWLSGSWGGPHEDTRVEEQWTDAGGNMMLGMGRTLRAGNTVFFEFLRIEARADGVYYVAQPKGRPGTDFKLTRMGPGEVVFENPAHDHPKRIIYRQGADGSLSARVDGGEGSRRSEEIRYVPLKKP